MSQCHNVNMSYHNVTMSHMMTSPDLQTEPISSPAHSLPSLNTSLLTVAGSCSRLAAPPPIPPRSAPSPVGPWTYIIVIIIFARCLSHRLDGCGQSMGLGRVGHTPAPDLAVHGAGVESVGVRVPGQVMDHPLMGRPCGQ